MIHYYHLYYYLIVLYVVLLSCYFCSLCAWFSLCFATFTLYNALTLRYLQQSFKQIGRLLGPVWWWYVGGGRWWVHLFIYFLRLISISPKVYSVIETFFKWKMVCSAISATTNISQHFLSLSCVPFNLLSYLGCLVINMYFKWTQLLYLRFSIYLKLIVNINKIDNKS